MVIKRKSPSKHIVDPYKRGRFTVDPHIRGKGKLKQKEDEKPNGTHRKVTVGSKPVEKTVSKSNEIKTMLPPHLEDSIQIIHMSPQEYLMLAAPRGFGPHSQYKLDRIQEKIGKGEELLIPSLDIFADSMDVVASDGVGRALWAHKKGIRRIPVMVVHTDNKPNIMAGKQYTPTTKGKDINYKKLIRQGHLGPSAWDRVKDL